MGGATLARGHAAPNLGAVLDHLSGVEGALLAGEALHDHLGVLAAFLTASTIFLAPSLMLSAGMMAMPLSRSSCLPSSTLVPSRRTTTGTLTPTSFTAAMMPSAIMSQRTMPPKMLTQLPSSLSEARSTSGRAHV
ncbi:hypothetical protein G6F61_014399 [Rhizopus arrhizus]|nr:hypothetical protein G6F61_014399 [Rhizopus arrhizus]